MKNFLDTYNVETPLCDPEKYPYRHVLMRFFCERDYIRDNQRTLRNVMHSDTDVIFQADIFDPSYVDPQGGLVGFAETYARVIKDSEPNKRWIEDCYGREALETLLMRPRVCAGTIFGEAKAYMDAMDKVMIPKLPTCNDQGIYIVAMYLGIFAKAGIKTTVQDFAHGAVATLNAPMARVDMFGRVVNEDMRPYAAVHMAKRNAVIKEVIESQYPLSDKEQLKLSTPNQSQWRDQFKNEISNNDDDDEEAQHKDTPDAKPDKEGS
ncbi:hypothetical protein SARC_03532 [Sphaeroforma arctica JP610]|uniref:Uncharacterized protein n=1 Tax=Sphaeroforma arctica JP610 TaxID=667725 RepID=A0A0L0G5W5_9EUKA|nr:hypothetical protein SARC_03532 [Sphaeroforma arctica JP610]KNC84231.1 hypothetical protein SARC_03532 [Sphaeroforma arctica JP610]|eukprot:XP_014158133.1 hypothetical protein SARC_03532 [Sphaeroforma arctica JP610]